MSLSRFALPSPSVESNLPLQLRNRTPPPRRYPTMDTLESSLSHSLFHRFPHSCDYRPMKLSSVSSSSTHGAAAAISPLLVLSCALTPRLYAPPPPGAARCYPRAIRACAMYPSVRAVPSPYPLPASRVPPRHVGVCVGRNQDQDRSFHRGAPCSNLQDVRVR